MNCLVFGLLMLVLGVVAGYVICAKKSSSVSPLTAALLTTGAAGLGYLAYQWRQSSADKPPPTTGAAGEVKT